MDLSSNNKHEPMHRWIVPSIRKTRTNASPDRSFDSISHQQTPHAAHHFTTQAVLHGRVLRGPDEGPPILPILCVYINTHTHKSTPHFSLYTSTHHKNNKTALRPHLRPHRAQQPPPPPGAARFHRWAHPPPARAGECCVGLLGFLI